MNLDSLAVLFDGPLSTLITAGGLIAVAIINARQGARLKRIDHNSSTAAEQTANDHEGAQYPNLREEHTATRLKVEQIEGDVREVRGMIHGVERSMKAVERWLADISRGHEDLTASIDRKDEAQRFALAAAVEERNNALAQRDHLFNQLQADIPTLVRQQIDAHLRDTK